MIGKDEGTPDVVLQALSQEMRSMYEASWQNEETNTLRKYLLKEDAAKARSIEGRQNIYKDRKKL